MVSVSVEEQEIISSIVALFQRADASAAGLEELNAAADDVVALCDVLMAKNVELVAFVRDLREHAQRQSLAAWAATPNAKMTDSPWNRMANLLSEVLAQGSPD